MIKLVVFDLDDTLYNEMDFVKQGFRSVCDYLSLKYSLENNSLFNYCVEVLNQQGRGHVFNSMCKKYNFEEDIDTLVSLYRNTTPKLTLYEDAKELIWKLESNYKLGIITDGLAAVQWKKINALNLEKVFDKVIVTDDLGKDYWKPNKHCFEEMLGYFCFKSKEAVYVGDNPNKDFVGAKEAGYLTVRVIRDTGDYMKLVVNKEQDADCKIYDLRELVNMI